LRKKTEQSPKAGSKPKDGQQEGNKTEGKATKQQKSNKTAGKQQKQSIRTRGIHPRQEQNISLTGKNHLSDQKKISL
jgi:hypothetical protein